MSKLASELISVTVKKNRIALSCLMLFAASSSMAMSLGRHRATALIGRPVDISVQAVIDAQEDLANLCLEADVFLADNKVDSSRVRVTAERALPGSQDLLIHVRSSALIDEPVVTVYLRAGCQQKTERRYVVLADLASEAAPALLPSTGLNTRPASQTQPGSGGSTPMAASSSISNPSGTASAASLTRPGRGRLSGSSGQAPGAASSTGDTNSKKPEVLAAGELSPSAVASGQRSRSIKASEKTEKSRARLKLDPIDLTFERDPRLKSSLEMLSTPAVSEQERSVAAALWRALTAQPQDILRDAEKLKALENSVRELQAQSLKNQKTITDLNGQLTQAQSERYANPFVYALIALLLLAIAAMVYLWRLRSVSRESYDEELPWWRKNKPLEKGWAGRAADSEPIAQLGDAETGKKGTKKSKPSRPSELDIDLDLNSDDSDFTEASTNSSNRHVNSFPPLSSKDRSDFGMSMTHMSRAVKAEELFDVQQQADFFISLGQHEQAIEVLRNHIDDSGQTSAMVYLDLFNLYHQLQRQADYEALREDFNQRFNAKIPSFELYTLGSLGLEAYQGALSRIEALWPSAKVLEVIEESIFRGADSNAEAFDLEAYRELLLLYSIAKEIIVADSPSGKSSKFGALDSLSSVGGAGGKAANKFMSTSIQPLSASVAELTRPQEPTIAIVPSIPRASPRLGLDVDLSDLFNESEDLTATVESDSSFFEQFANNADVDQIPVIDLPAKKIDSDIDNLIDFDEFDSSVDGGNNQQKPPKL